MGFTNGFAVPACTFAVDLTSCHTLILFRCPFEGVGEFVLLDLVVMVDKSAFGLLIRIRVVSCWGELVGVPGEIDIQGWDSDMFRVVTYDLKEYAIF
jgi:hypothetical protein